MNFAAIYGDAGDNNPFALQPDEKVLLLWTYASNGIAYSASSTLAQQKTVVYKTDKWTSTENVTPSQAIDAIFERTDSGFAGNLLSNPVTGSVAAMITAAQTSPQTVFVEGFGNLKCVAMRNTDLAGDTHGYFGLSVLKMTVI